MKGVNKFAQILITERSKVDLKEVLGLSTFSIERSLEMDPSLADQMSDDEEEEVCTDETCTDDGHAHGHGHAAAAAAAAEGKQDTGHGHGHGHAGGHGHGHGHGANAKVKKKVHDLSRVSSLGMKLEGYLDSKSGPPTRT